VLKKISATVRQRVAFVPLAARTCLLAVSAAPLY